MTVAADDRQHLRVRELHLALASEHDVPEAVVSPPTAATHPLLMVPGRNSSSRGWELVPVLLETLNQPEKAVRVGYVRDVHLM